MDGVRFWLFVMCLGFFLGIASLFVYFRESRSMTLESRALVASTSSTYMGPQKPVVGDPQLVRVQLIVKDATDSSGPQIVSVTFNGKNVPLQPRDIYGNRGAASFQLKPGKYRLRWRTNRDKFAWPRTLNHEEIVEISPRDLWLQVTIQGDTASIR
jgi:hypothetical protein